MASLKVKAIQGESNGYVTHILVPSVCNRGFDGELQHEDVEVGIPLKPIHKLAYYHPIFTNIRLPEIFH